MYVVLSGSFNRFAFASLLPALLLEGAALRGGTWTVLAILAITVFAFGMDRLVLGAPQPKADEGILPHILGLLHFPLLGLVIWAVGAGHLSPLGTGLLICAAGLYFGQISNSNAHELIHRKDRLSRRLGVMAYASLFHGHHDSAHRLVHHVHAGTPQDPNTARLGEGFWRFALRATRDEYRAGLMAEQRRRKGRPLWTHPYLHHALISLTCLAIAGALSGWVGMAALLTIAVYAQMQLLLSDYVQHYGLMRRRMPDGSYEPMGPQHAWNAPHWYSAAMMLNAPLHSDHHMKPGKSYSELSVDSHTMPMLPHALPVMAVIALVPPLWRKVMNKRVRKLHPETAQQTRAPREIAPVMLVRMRGTGQRLGKLSQYDNALPQNRNYPLSMRAPGLRPDERF